MKFHYTLMAFSKCHISVKSCLQTEVLLKRVCASVAMAQWVKLLLGIPVSPIAGPRFESCLFQSGSLLMHIMGGSRLQLKHLDPYHPWRIPGLGLWLLASARLIKCGHLGSNPVVGRRFSLSHSLSLSPGWEPQLPLQPSVCECQVLKVRAPG